MSTRAISLRVPEERLSIIDRGAAARGQNRSEFLIESSYREAVAAISESPIVHMDDDMYDAFVAALEAPANPNDRLKSVLTTKAPWE